MSSPFIRGSDVPPTLTSIDPTVGVSEEFVTATGVGFEDAPTVTVNGEDATDVAFVSSTTVTFTAPALADGGPYEVCITNPNKLSCKLYSALTVGWSPMDLSPAVYHRADTGVTGTSTVSQWDDISGNGNHLTSSGGNRPALVAADAAYNNHPTINFASSKYMDNAAWGASVVGDMTLFVIGNCGAADDYHCPFDGAHATGSETEVLILSNPANVGTNLSNVLTDFVIGGLAPAGQVSSACLAVASITAATTATDLYVNSYTPQIHTTAAPIANPPTVHAHRVGALYDSAFWGMTGYWDGKIAEVGLVAGAISAANMVKLADYAANRYGMTIKYLNINPASISGVSPANGDDLGGTAVTVKGWGFTKDGGATGITFGGTAGTSFVVVDDNTITCVTPAKAAASVDVVVTNANGHMATLSSGYEFLVTAYTLNAAVWYRSDRGITLVSGNVSAWNNTSPNASDSNRNLTDAGSSLKRPTYSASDAAFNNHPSLAYDTAAKQLLSGTLSSGLTTPQTLIVVGKPAAAAGSGQIYLGGPSKPWMYKNAADTHLYGIDSSLGDLGAHSGAFIAIIVFNGASSAHMKNTTTSTTFNAGAGHTIGTVWTGVTLAGTDSGWLAEAAVVSGAMSLSDRQALMTALGKYYAIAIS